MSKDTLWHRCLTYLKPANKGDQLGKLNSEMFPMGVSGANLDKRASHMAAMIEKSEKTNN